ncbi:MAG: hypothetical protein ACR2QQ_13990, partial [Gammaproteobacteria bacterium]
MSIKPLCLLLFFSFLTLTSHAQEPLPSDVYPDSRSRVPLFAPEVPAGFANITAHGSGSLVRWEFALGRPLSELAILTVAREFDQPYEWSLHEIEALAVGLEQQVIDVVRERGAVTGLSDEQAIIIQMGREIYGEHSLAAETYA